ncbi:MAG: hypothetical protein HWN81_07950 [Candidatus Lokiarchaeota archaeon]|nr:hypothetical protein [Candidatus Lokiarchaeota archaeon]
MKELQGIKLGWGSFVIPEKFLLFVETMLKVFDIKSSHFRVWMQEI